MEHNTELQRGKEHHSTDYQNVWAVKRETPKVLSVRIVFKMITVFKFHHYFDNTNYNFRFL